MARTSRSRDIRNTADVRKNRYAAPRPKRSLGQNFLVDSHYIERIVNAVAPVNTDTIIEIGPGRGALTERLIASEADLTVIELDGELSLGLREKFDGAKNLKVVEGDALTANFAELSGRSGISSGKGGAKVKLVANLPYNISTPILLRLIDQRGIFSDLVLMFQREVADRITAEPGTRERGYLTVLVEAAFDVEKLFDVPPRAFRPVPKVWSSIVRLIPKVKHDAGDGLRRLLAAAFAQKRKTLANNLKAVLPDHAQVLQAAGIDPSRRAETLTLDEWLRLNDTFRNKI